MMRYSRARATVLTIAGRDPGVASSLMVCQGVHESDSAHCAHRAQSEGSACERQDKGYDFVTLVLAPNKVHLLFPWH